MAGQRVRDGLQRGVGEAGERGHGGHHDDAAGQADAQGGQREAHHAAQVDAARTETPQQTAHRQRKHGGRGALQEQAQAAHADA